MQSPDKIRARLNEMLGAPGADVEPMELALRSMVRVVAPTIAAYLQENPAETIDYQLEGVAHFFLSLRSDGQALSVEFLQALAELAAVQPGHDGTPAEPPAPAPAPAWESVQVSDEHAGGVQLSDELLRRLASGDQAAAQELAEKMGDGYAVDPSPAAPGATTGEAGSMGSEHRPPASPWGE